MESSESNHIFTANDLRAIAESADGLRDRTLVLGVDATGKLRLDPLADGQKPGPGQIVLRTASQAAQRTCPVDLMLTHPKGNQVKIDPIGFDAVLWDEAAYEKFLVPYYVRFYSEAQMAKLKAAIASPNVMAIAHRPPTIWTDITENGPQQRISEVSPSLLLRDAQAGYDDGWVSLDDWIATN